MKVEWKENELCIIRVEPCKSVKLWGEMVKELADSVTETQILQKRWKN